MLAASKTEARLNTPLLEWTDALALDQNTMDDTHREFVDLLNRVAASPAEGLLASLDEFVKHTEEHFSQEERWMQEFAFPPLHCHQGEHANVLEVVREVRKRVADGQVQLGKTLTEALAEWFPQHAGSMDAVLAMYHDQALIPVKYLGIEDGVNVTLGLPFVRTSPDHGTALDIAGAGRARPDSMIEAILCCAEIVSRTA